MGSGKRKPRPVKKSKKIYYFIVEGYTEENYINLLKQTYKKEANIKNCNGGSAKNVLKQAKKIVSKKSDDYLGYIIWFDQDRYDTSSDHNLKNSLESKNDVNIYISSPCVENWLLAHFESVNLNLSSCKICERKLGQYIPNYEKNDCCLLTKYIQREQIKRAITNYPEIGEIPQKIQD